MFIGLAIPGRPTIAQALATHPQANLSRATASQLVQAEQPKDLFKKAWELLDAGKPAQALEIFDRLLQTYPNHAPTLVGRANSLYELKRYQEAIATYKQALA